MTQALQARAGELGATLQVSDGKEKVWRRGDLLVGEVTELSSRLERRRRIYLAPGASLEVDITDREARIRARGGVGCVVFGNRFTQELAGSSVAGAGGRVNEGLIESIFALAGERTASVSREHTILKSDKKPSDPRAALQKALRGGLPEERLEAMRSAVILAGGNGLRLGAEKSLLEFEGKSLICWTLRSSLRQRMK